MKKQKWLKILNIFVMIGFALVAIAIVLYDWGPAAWQGSGFLYSVHVIAGRILILLIIAHLILNWSWVRNAYCKKKQRS